MLSQAPADVVTKTSARPVPATLERLQIAVQEKGLMVFALVDHSGQAAKAGLAMPDTKLLIFGSPAGGTPIMLAAPLAALDLPLKVLVWENPAGGSFVSYLDPAYLGARHQLTDDLTARIAGINTITDAAVGRPHRRRDTTSRTEQRATRAQAWGEGGAPRLGADDMMVPIVRRRGTVKVGVVGVGGVGAATVLSLIERGGMCREIVLVDRTMERANGVATDMRYATPLSPTVDVRAGDYDALGDAALVILTAGVNERAGGATDRSDPQGRLRLLDTNAKVYAQIVPKVVAVAPGAVLMVVTDPPDPLADLTRRLAGHDRVFSTGTLIDSLRFRVHLADRLRVRPRDVQAMVVGEHGTSEVLLWSSASVGGIPVLELLGQDGQSVEELRQEVERDIRYANITIIEGTGASQYGIGAVSARLAEAVLRDERAVLPVAAYAPRYEVTLSLVSVLGAGGVQQLHEPPMTSGERAALERSAAALREAASRILATVP